MQCQFKNKNIRTYVESYDITQSVFMAFLCIFVSFSRNIGHTARNECSCFYFASQYACILPTRLSAYWWVGLKAKAAWVALFFLPSLSPLSVWVVGKHKEVTQIKKDMIDFLGPSCFFQCHFLLSVLEVSSSSNRKHGLLGRSAPLLSRGPATLTPSSVWGSPASHRWRPLEFCAHGTRGALEASGLARRARHTYWVYLLCLLTWSSIP